MLSFNRWPTHAFTHNSFTTIWRGKKLASGQRNPQSKRFRHHQPEYEEQRNKGGDPEPEP